MNLVFLGTPDFAVPSLLGLHGAGHTFLLVICQPDRPAGRGRSTRACPVKRQAESLGLPVLQPETLDAQAVHRVVATGAELAVVVAYGLILPSEFLRTPRRGCINLHASLLPRYRGAAPVAHAVLQGERITGVTTLLMDEGIDTGPILLQRETPIGHDEAAGEVESRLASLGADLLVQTLSGLEKGTLRPRPQSIDRETYSPKILPEAGRIRWETAAEAIARQVRALNPRPGAFTVYQKRHVKIWRARASEIPAGEGASPGTILEGAGSLRVTCGGGSCLEVLEVQMEGRRRVSGGEALRGRWFGPGGLFGDAQESAGDGG